MTAPGLPKARVLPPGLRAVRVSRLSGLVATRAVLGCTAMLLATAAVTLLALMLGAVFFGPVTVLHALVGESSRLAELYVVDWRLPRAVAAVVFGAALGMSGAVFQCLTRNPLGSPDIIGFTAGASAGGVAMVTLVGSSYAVVAGGALGGGFAVALLVLLLSRGGGAGGFRLVIVGIGLSAMLVSLETWLTLIADLDIAQVAALWSVGSLTGTGFEHSGPAMLLCLVAMVLTVALLGRRLSLLDLGEDAAAGLGVPPGPTRVAGIVAGVVLVALVTAATGPIAFVALAAPHIGRRVAGTSGVSLGPAACAGALVLASADLVAQHAVPGSGYPVGVVTVAVGGIYLISLLVRENRKGTL